MATRQIIVFLLLAGFASAALASRRSEVIDFLKKENIWANCQRQNKNENECIKELKRLCGMKNIGGPEITDELMDCVRREKCGLPTLPNVNVTFVETHPKFTKKDLTYFVLNNGRKNSLSPAETAKTIELAFAVWACYSPLTFSKVESVKEADIVISFAPKYHGYINYFTKEEVRSDNNPFDGPGGILAHAFLPYSGGVSTGNFHYDDAETWIADHTSGIKVFHTTVHELGHILGINHLKGQEIMKASYDDSYHESELDLGQGDITEIQYRYGSKECTNKIWQEYYDKKYPDINRSCKDKASNCESRSFKQCFTDKNWMKDNCAKYCGYCGDCKNIYEKCSRYNDISCKGGSWFVRNCKEHCALCAAKTTLEDYERRYEKKNKEKEEDEESAEKKREEAKKPKPCGDAYPACTSYPKEQCSSPTHYVWMYQNCRKFCGWCKSMDHTFGTESDNQLQVCRAEKLDGIFRVADGSVYIIVGGILYKREDNEKTISSTFKLKIRDLGARGLRYPTAAAYSIQSKKLYLFEGSKMFIVNKFGTTEQSTEAVELPQIAKSPRAAFIQRSNVDEINLYKNKQIITIRFEDGIIRVQNVQPFAKIFDAGNYRHRIPISVDGIYQEGRKVYFFTGSSVIVAHRAEDGRYTLPARSAPFATTFLSCPQTE